MKQTTALDPGVWMERDPESPRKWAGIFSALILFATAVELVHTGYRESLDDQIDAQMAGLLFRLTELSENNPELDRCAGRSAAPPGVSAARGASSSAHTT